MRLAVVIPALNEAENLVHLVPVFPAVVRVVVVDNGSTDATAAVAREAGAEVVREPRRGYGSAVQAGMRHLASDPPDALVILDADLSDDLTHLPRLLEPLRTGRADLVLSERVTYAEPGALTRPQRFGNQLATRLIRGLTGHRYRDMGPFRAIRWTALVQLEMADPTWGWNVEMQIKAVSRGLRVVEVAVPYRCRRFGKSKISGDLRGSLRAGGRILQAVWVYRGG